MNKQENYVIPAVLMADNQVTDGAKLLYAHMLRHSEDRLFNVDSDALSKQYDVTTATIRNYVNVLIEYGYIKQVNRRRNFRTMLIV